MLPPTRSDSRRPHTHPPALPTPPTRRHFGTDRQWGSFLWVIATALYGAGEVAALLTVAEGGEDDVMGGGGPRLEDINGVLQLLSAALFMWGSWKFYVGNYPDARDELEAELKGFDASSVPFRVRYFTHNDQLLGSWLFALACLPCVVISFSSFVFVSVFASAPSSSCLPSSRPACRWTRVCRHPRGEAVKSTKPPRVDPFEERKRLRA